MSDTVCIRRPFSTWTKCRCDNCRPEQNRLDKHRKILGYTRTPWEDGWAVLAELAELGWSGAAIADAYDLPARLCQEAVTDYHAGRVRPFGNRIARRLVDGPIRRPRHGMVPAIGSTRRLQALAVLGWTLADIRARNNVTASVLADAQSGRRPTIHATAAAAIADVYEPLSARRGASTRATFRARKLGWVAPLAWDDIDDPDAQPHGVDNSRGRPPLRRIEDMRADGKTVEEIARTLKMRAERVRAVLAKAEGEAA